MISEIKAEIKTLSRIFIYDNFFYQIPDYQRPYSWDKDNLSDLLDDLVNAFKQNNEENYFCGSLVLVNNGNRYDVIDGQQRLTTFTILFCVLRGFYFEILTSDRSDRIKALIERSIRDEFDETKKRLRFLTGEVEQNNFFQTVLKNGIDRNARDKKNQYLTNALILNDLITYYLNDDEIQLNLSYFIEWIFENVVLTTIICPNQDTAIQIFNVLNDRGMPLSSVDILKSNLMTSLDAEGRNSFKGDWETIKSMLKNVGLEFDNLFTIYLYYTITENPKTTLHKELLISFKNKNSLSIIHDIKEFAESYIKVLKAQDIYVYSLKYLKHQVYWTTILTVAKHVEYENYDELKKLIFAFYYQNLIAGATITRFKQTSFNILKKIKSKSSVLEIKNIIKENLDKFNTTKSYKEAIESSFAYDQKWIKPVLVYLEYKHNDNSNQNFIPLDNKFHIEHILPQNKNDEHGWNKIFSDEDREIYTNSIGNLTLLSMRKNIQAQDHKFEDKKDIYTNRDNVSTSFELTRRIFENTSWTKETIDTRKIELINKLNEDIDIFK